MVRIWGLPVCRRLDGKNMGTACVSRRLDGKNMGTACEQEARW
jgi:hypothetical protein